MSEQVELVHPLYLDVPMMTSFLAALEDGVAYGADVRRRQQRQSTTAGSGDAPLAEPQASILASLFDFNLRGEITGNNAVGDSEEVTLIRKHTEASLFMRLRRLLQSNALLTEIDSVQLLPSIRHSSLVEITGQITRNPLSDILEAFSRFATFMGVAIPAGNSPKPQGSKSHQGNQRRQQLPGGQAAAVSIDQPTLDLFSRMQKDMEESKVLDVVMHPMTIPDLTVVIALGVEFMQQGTLDYILSGNFTVLGKVSRVLKEDETINLFQRSAFSFFDSSLVGSAFEGIQKSDGLNLSKQASVVKAPALQIIPLAIYV